MSSILIAGRSAEGCKVSSAESGNKENAVYVLNIGANDAEQHGILWSGLSLYVSYLVRVAI